MSRQEIIERLDREFGVCDRHIVRINEALDSLDWMVRCLLSSMWI